MRTKIAKEPQKRPQKYAPLVMGVESKYSLVLCSKSRYSGTPMIAELMSTEIILKIVKKLAMAAGEL